jgi:hypothetical protein
MSEDDQRTFDSHYSSFEKFNREIEMWKKKPPSTIRGIKLRDLERKKKSIQDILVTLVFGIDPKTYGSLLEDRIARLKEMIDSKETSENGISTRRSVEIQCELVNEGKREGKASRFSDVGVQCVFEEPTQMAHSIQVRFIINMDLHKSFVRAT